jgi:outer membrane protein assembly factor BamA
METCRVKTTAFRILFYFLGGFPAVVCAQADSIAPAGPRFSGFPYVYYTPETRTAFGATAVVTFRTAPDPTTRPSSLTLTGFYSVNKQFNIALSPEFFLSGNRQWVTATVEYGRFTDKYWGVGPAASDAALVDFTRRTAHFLLRAQTTLFDQAKVGVILEIDQTKISDGEELLPDGPFPGASGARSTGIGGGLTWDSRDNVFYPGRGGLYQVESTFFPGFLGSEYAFTRTTIDLRRYLSLGGDHILAFQLFGTATGGTPPLFKLPGLGGENLMRGYYLGRYRDRLAAAAQAEYRVVLYRRLGLAAFTGIGDVAPEISSFTLHTFKFSAGLGLRFTLDPAEHLNVRVDYGAGRETDGLYFSLREAF